MHQSFWPYEIFFMSAESAQQTVALSPTRPPRFLHQTVLSRLHFACLPLCFLSSFLPTCLYIYSILMFFFFFCLAEIESVASQHRVLIFAQMKAMLDIIESDLLKVHMPSVTYLRMDGTFSLLFPSLPL